MVPIFHGSCWCASVRVSKAKTCLIIRGGTELRTVQRNSFQRRFQGLPGCSRACDQTSAPRVREEHATPVFHSTMHATIGVFACPASTSICSRQAYFAQWRESQAFPTKPDSTPTASRTKRCFVTGMVAAFGRCPFGTSAPGAACSTTPSGYHSPTAPCAASQACQS